MPPIKRRAQNSNQHNYRSNHTAKQLNDRNEREKNHISQTCGTQAM